MPELCVRHVEGRYPYRGVFRSENIECAVVPDSNNVYHIRLDDSAPGHEDMWMVIDIQLVEEEVE